MSEKRGFSHYCRATFLSCERYTQLASRAIDAPLTLREKLQFWAHHMLCVVCRRFRRQIALIEKAAKRYENSASGATSEDISAPSLGADVKMPLDVKARIESNLREKSHQ